jgi:hypothetical protein
VTSRTLGFQYSRVQRSFLGWTRNRRSKVWAQAHFQELRNQSTWENYLSRSVLGQPLGWCRTEFTPLANFDFVRNLASVT